MWPFAPAYPTVSVEDVGCETAFTDDTAGNTSKGVYDYIIVGGGTAGCVLASRLTEDPSVSVLLVERGGCTTTWSSRVPLISSDYAAKNSPAITLSSTPLKDVDGLVVNTVIGNGLGGGSRINAMLYTRGMASEFNRWSENGRKGWSYEDVKPYFMKSENALSQPGSDHRGTDGPWQNRPLKKYFFDSVARCADAAVSLGFPLVEDINSPETPAVACAKLDMTVDQDERRCSTFDAFLPVELALKRKDRLHICTYAVVTSVDIRPDSGNELQAVGIFFQAHNSASPQSFYARARREVILCAGAISSPQVLMLSGIGPKEHIGEKGIRVKKNLPGVGSNLQDHFGVSTMYRIPLSDSLHVLTQSPFRAIQELLKYIFWGDGLFLAPVTQISLFARSRLLDQDSLIDTSDLSQLDSSNPENIPDIEIMTIPHKSTDESVDLSDGRGVFSFLGVILQPHSSGTVRLASSDAKTQPIVDLAFLSDPADYAALRKAVKLSKALAEKMRESGYHIADHLVPDSNGDDDLDAFIRKTARTTFHYSSTCRMAPEDDPLPGVVDDELKVHGVRGLRVADCSIFPQILATHLQAPAVMVAEKCADMLRSVSKTYT